MRVLPHHLRPSPDWNWKQGALAFLALLFLFTEFGLRAVNLPRLQQRLDPVEFEQGRSPLQAHPYTAFACKPGWSSAPDARFQIQHNSLGFRGPETGWEKPEGVTRIVCLGGSSTYGEGISDDEHTWPARLQALLATVTSDTEFEVINLGVPGYSTFESLAQFATSGVELEPDVVVIYHGMDDLRSSLSDSPTPDNTHYRSNWPTTYRGDLDTFFESSRVYRLMRSLVTNNAVRRLEGEAIATRSEPTETVADISNFQGFENWERNLRSLVALSHSVGAKVFLVSQAVDHRDLVGNSNYEARVMGLERMRAALPTLARGLGVGFVDGARILEREALRQIEESGSENVFAWEDRLRDPGAELLSLSLADSIMQVELAH